MKLFQLSRLSDTFSQTLLLHLLKFILMFFNKIIYLLKVNTWNHKEFCWT